MFGVTRLMCHNNREVLPRHFHILFNRQISVKFGICFTYLSCVAGPSGRAV